MKFGSTLLATIVAGILGLSASAYAQQAGTETSRTPFNSSSGGQVEASESRVTPNYLQWTGEDIRQSQAWGMSQTEWMEYKRLMSTGQNAAYYANKPELTPLMVMGINAKTDYERTRFAKLSVDMERERLTKEIKFDEAVNQYIKTLIPTHPVWMRDDERRAWAKRNAVAGINSTKASGKENTLAVPIKDTRTVAYVDAANCDSKCVGFIKGLAGRSTKLNRLDLFVLNAGTDDDLLSFARKAGISSRLLSDARATVNYDSGYYARLKPAPGLPVAYRVQLNDTVELKP
ncbi:hypothetical protein [Aeromonas sp. Y311-2]|uniref:hypothetical protein n=1 Tax=Aeromonas sp. Y311-2 TaxID=2990507 RepID=UPI0022E47D9B|nr:hypothetical protein [Aeromonas sp. Y311-2]